VSLLRIAVSIGDPAGVGAEIVLKALADPALIEIAEWIVVGDDARAEGSGAGLSRARRSTHPLRRGGSARLHTTRPHGRTCLRIRRGAIRYVRAATEMCSPDLRTPW